MVNVRLREWLTRDLLDRWLVPKRLYMLGFAGEIGVNPDQRIQQDAQHLSEVTTILAVGLVQSSLLLASFAGVLWVLSDQVVFDLGNGLAIPGYMVWCALAYSLGGSLFAWRVGRPLIPLNAERYAREADLRIALVRISEHADGIVLHGGEADERRLLEEPVDGVVSMVTASRAASRDSPGSRPAMAGSRWWCRSWSRRPAISAAMSASETLMVVVGAFNTRCRPPLRWFVDNLPQIADWRATLLRVVGLSRCAGRRSTRSARTRVASRSSESTSDKLELDNFAARAARSA